MTDMCAASPGPERLPSRPRRTSAFAATSASSATNPTICPLVVSTATAAKLPAPRAERGRWLWVSGRRCLPRARWTRVLRGAYDVVAARRAAMRSTTMRRATRGAAHAGPAAAGRRSPRSGERRVARGGPSGCARRADGRWQCCSTGETGTGKEVTGAADSRVVAAAQDSRFVPINCAAIPDELMEAELFGYARGAFSGAVQATTAS